VLIYTSTCIIKINVVRSPFNSFYRVTSYLHLELPFVLLHEPLLKRFEFCRSIVYKADASKLNIYTYIYIFFFLFLVNLQSTLQMEQ
jgi:hypothetical protein